MLHDNNLPTMTLQKDTLWLVGSSVYTAPLYNDAGLVCTMILVQKHQAQGSLEDFLPRSTCSV